MRSLAAISHRLAHLARAQVGLRVIVAATIIALFAFSAVVALSFRQATHLIDDIDRDFQADIARNYLRNAGHNTVAQQRIQVTWDTAYRAVGQGSDIGWADAYLGQYLWTSFDLDRMFLVDPRGKVLRAWAQGKPVAAETVRPVAGLIAARLSDHGRDWETYGTAVGQRDLGGTRWPTGAVGQPLTRYSAALAGYGGAPVLLTITAILPDIDYSLMDREPNYLVSLQTIDGPFLKRMSRDLMLEQLAYSPSPSIGEGRHGIPIVSSNGQTLGTLQWAFEADSAVVRGQVKPLFSAYLLFLLAVLACIIAILKRMERAVRESEASRRAAEWASHHDPMTGLPNRTQFLAALGERLAARDPTDEDALVAVAYFDLDQFKLINDTMGHGAGDELICAVAERLRQWVQEPDLLARLGGDEFVVLAVGRRAEGRILGAEIMRCFAEPFEIQGQLLDIRASCGVSVVPDYTTDGADLIRQADIALYQAKHRGGGRWRAFIPDMAEAVQERHYLELDLRRAIESEDLAMAYQPIVEATTGKLVAVEALLRWQHPERGAVSPASFVAVAEQCGLMNQLGRWTIDRVFADMALMPGINVSINLSPVQVMSRDFLGELEDAVLASGIDPHRVTFEITEGVLLDNSVKVLEVLETLKLMGFQVALDDFGTGYSSLGYLRQFQFDRIKIDRTFVQNIENDLDALAVLKAIVALGRSLRMVTVAEGVETELQRQLVVAAGCQLIQGHLFANACAPAEIAAITPVMDAARQPKRKRA